MALSTRELLLVLRVSDRTGGALRRVSGDLNKLNSRSSLQSELRNRQSILATAAARTKDARAASANATATLRNMRLQRDAAANSIAVMKEQQLQDGKTMMAVQAETKAYEKLTAAIVTQTDVAKKLRTTRLAMAGAEDLANQRLLATQRTVNEFKWDKLAQGARLLEHIGRAAAIGGAIGVFALGGAARQAAGFQTQLALAASQARPVGAPASATLQIQSKLQDVVLKQMQKFPAASQDMANSLYEIFSGTNIQNISQASQALKLFNQMAVAGGSDLATMTQAGISLINNFDNGKFSIKGMRDEANLFFAAVRYGRMNAQQFADSLSNVVPIAKEAGLSFRDVADAMAFLTRQSGAKYTSRDATGLMREIQLFARPEMIAGMHKIGVEVETAGHKMRPLLDIIKDFVKTKFGASIRGTVQAVTAFKTLSALGGAGTGSRGFQGTAQAARVFAFQINDWKEYDRVSKLVNTDQKEFNKSYAALAQTPGVKWQVFINQLKALSITIGTAVIPVFGKLGVYVKAAVNWFQQLSPHTKTFIAQMALFISVGALVGGAILAIVGGLASLFFTVRIGLRSFGLLGSETGAISTRMALFMPILAGVLFVLIQYPQIFQRVTNAVGGTANAIKLLGVFIAVLSFQKIIGGLVGVASEATIATSGVLGLRGALLSLPTAIATTIVVTRVIQELHGLGGRNAPSINKPIDAKALGGYWVPGSKGKPVFHFGGMPSDLAKQAAMSNADIASQRAGSLDPTGKFGSNTARIAYDKTKTAMDALNKKATVLAVATGIPTVNMAKLERNVLVAKEALRGLDPVKDFKKYYDAELKLNDAQAALQAATTKAQYSAYTKSLDAKTAAEKKALSKSASNQSKALKLQNTTYQDALNNLNSMYSSFLQQQQQNYGQLFQGPVLSGARIQTITQWGGHASPADLLKDVKAQNFQYSRLNRLIGGLRRRGAPTELVNQLRAAGPAAMQDIYNLTKMTPSQWKQYVAAFKAGQAAIKKETMSQLQNQIDLYRQHGKNIAKAIVAGITSEDTKLQSAIENLLRKQLGLKPTADYKGKPKSTSIHQTIHVTGTPGDYHKTRAAVRHSLFRVRVHTSGAH